VACPPVGSAVGAGGNVETSAGVLDVQGIYVDTRAADGSAGDWLLDPWNLVIGQTGANEIVARLATSNVTISTDARPTNASGGWLALDGIGECGSCGDMVLQGTINYTGSQARRLTLKAAAYISILNSITSSNAALDVIVWTDANGNADGDGGLNGGNGGYIYVAPGVNISTNGGRIVLAGQTDTNGDGIPDGFAYNVRTSDRAGVQLGPISGVGSSINLLSGGGDIVINGYSGGSSPYPGIATQK
jgi:hypothetical protein